MLCVHVDNIVLVSNKTRDTIGQITEVFMAKEGAGGWAVKKNVSFSFFFSDGEVPTVIQPKGADLRL